MVIRQVVSVILEHWISLKNLLLGRDTVWLKEFSRRQEWCFAILPSRRGIIGQAP